MLEHFDAKIQETATGCPKKQLLLSVMLGVAHNIEKDYMYLENLT
jgi:hypothetical protein